jgi:DNA-binding MurR/RpiR family transcriptional regulator
VVIIGCMASASLAAHFGRMLGKVFPKIDVINSEGVLESTKLLQLTRDSTVILIAFPRYPMATIRLGQAALKSGAKVIAITDSHLSPISNLGDAAFHIHLGIPSYADAYAAPLTFINAICTEIAEKMSNRAVQNLDRFDRLAEDSQLFFMLTKRGRRNHKNTDESGLNRIRKKPQKPSF